MWQHRKVENTQFLYPVIKETSSEHKQPHQPSNEGKIISKYVYVKEAWFLVNPELNRTKTVGLANKVRIFSLHLLKGLFDIRQSWAPDSFLLYHFEEELCFGTNNRNKIHPQAVYHSVVNVSESSIKMTQASSIGQAGKWASSQYVLMTQRPGIVVCAWSSSTHDAEEEGSWV